MTNTSSKILDSVRGQIEKRYGRSLERIEAVLDETCVEYAGFGRAQNQQMYLDTYDHIPSIAHVAIDNVILLRPKTRRRILLEETGEVRQGHRGEYAAHENTSNEPICLLYDTLADVRIWKARELAPGEEVI